MTDPACEAKFAAALKDALDSAQTLREEAEMLSTSLHEETPAAIRTSTRSFEDCAQNANTVFERLLGVLRNANHHTLESAYQALVAEPGRQGEAEQMRELINEFRRARAVISRSERQINDTLLQLTDKRWAVAPHSPDDDSGVHAEA